MLSKPRLGASFTAASNILIVIGWVIPFWFGRFHGESSKTQWGLFYRIQCIRGRCQTIGGIISKSSVQFEGSESRVELEAIAILATIGMSMSIVGLLVLSFHWTLNGKHLYKYILSVAIIQYTAGLVVFLTVITGGIAAGDFLSIQKIESVIEFPWSILIYCFGLCFLFASAVIFSIILLRWEQYKHSYIGKRYRYNQATIAPETTERGPEPDVERMRTEHLFDRYQHSGTSNEPEIRFVDLNTPGYTGSLRYKYDPNRGQFVGYFTDLRNAKIYSSMPIKGNRWSDFTIKREGRCLSTVNWHSKLDKVLRESYQQRLDHFALRDTHI